MFISTIWCDQGRERCLFTLYVEEKSWQILQISCNKILCQLPRKVVKKAGLPYKEMCQAGLAMFWLIFFVSSAPDRMHSQVKTWTKNVDIFEKDFVFVPINERYVPKKSRSYYRGFGGSPVPLQHYWLRLKSLWYLGPQFIYPDCNNLMVQLHFPLIPCWLLSMQHLFRLQV